MTPGNARRCIVLLGALAALALAAPRAARAQTEAQKQQAKEHYQKARRYYDVGKYAEAIDEYQRVYLMIDDPGMLFNIAQAYRLWDRPDEAIRFYRNYLRRAPQAENRAVAEKHIADLERALEDRRRVVPAPPAPAPTPVPAPVAPAATEPAPSPPAPALAPPPTTTMTPPPLGGDPATTITETAPPPAERGRGRRIAAYSFLIGGGVFLVTSAIAGAVAAQKAKEIERAANAREPFDPTAEKAGKAANSVAVLTGLVGLAAGVTGAILLFTGGGSSEAATGPAVGIALIPVAGPGYAGGSASVTF